MEWTMVKNVGLGLNNKTSRGASKNICYINAIVQCLAVSPPFVHWLFNDTLDHQCEYVKVTCFYI